MGGYGFKIDSFLSLLISLFVLLCVYCVKEGKGGGGGSDSEI